MITARLGENSTERDERGLGLRAELVAKSPCSIAFDVADYGCFNEIEIDDRPNRILSHAASAAQCTIRMAPPGLSVDERH